MTMVKNPVVPQVTSQLLGFLLAFAILTVSLLCFANDKAHVARLTIDGVIGPATSDYFRRALQQATTDGATAAILQLDTPGGLDNATRDIIKSILDSPIPVITYVHPAGARAASAGTYILYASHVAAMSPSTTLGAATPVQPGSDSPVRDRRADKSDNGTADSGEPVAATNMERKRINDSVAFIRTLADRHHRNADWAELAVRNAATLAADEALQKQVIDFTATNIADLLAQVHNETVRMVDGESVLRTSQLPVVDYAPDWRNHLLAVITNPQIAYLLLLIGIYGLLFEGYSPGAMVPGVVGIICLLLGLYAMQVLPVNYAGLALIFLGAGLIAAELFMPSFGILGIGGIIALVFGSLMLMDTDLPEMMISHHLIGGMALASAALLALLVFMVGRNTRMPRPQANRALEGATGTVIGQSGDYALVRIHGEIWRAHGSSQLTVGNSVIVTAQHGLTLTVAPQTT